MACTGTALSYAYDCGWYLCERFAVYAVRNKKLSVFLLIFTPTFLPLPWTVCRLDTEGADERAAKEK